MALTDEDIEKRISDSYELPNNVLDIVQTPLVSVRTSTYNHGPYIRQCIEGVLMQKTNFQFEYIIGEDFSTDETREIVFEYAKKYPDKIRVVTADYNVGSKANGRRCIRKCRGKYMAICEGDDYWTDPYKLQKQVDFLEANPEYGLVWGRAQIYNENLGVFTGETGSGLLSFDELIVKNTIPTLTVLIRNECREGYYEYVLGNNWKMGDYPLWLYIASKSKIHFMDETFAVYRVSSNTASRPKEISAKIKFIESTADVQLFFAERNNCNHLFKTISANKQHDIVGTCMAAGYYDDAFKYLKQFRDIPFRKRVFLMLYLLRKKYLK